MTTISENQIPAMSDNQTNSVSHAVPAKTFGGSLSRITASLPHLDQRLMQFVSAHSISFMRLSLAIVFVWFGLMKLVHPASEFGMVIGTTYWFPLSPNFLVPAMGVTELLTGVAILFARGALLRLGLLFLVLHMLATFVVLVLMPDLSFHNGNPLILTNAGEYVVKNVVLIAAALLVLGSITGSEKKASGQSPNGTSVNGHNKGPDYQIESARSQWTAHRDGLGSLGIDVKSMSQRLDTLYRDLEEATHQIAQEANRQIAVSEKLATIGQLSAGMANNLRNPLGAIGAQSTAIRPETSNGSTKDEDERIHDNRTHDRPGNWSETQEVI